MSSGSVLKKVGKKDLGNSHKCKKAVSTGMTDVSSTAAGNHSTMKTNHSGRGKNSVNMKTRSKIGMYFLVAVLAAYAAVYLWRPSTAVDSIILFLRTFKGLFPILLLILCIMFVMEFFFLPKRLASILSRYSGIRAWLLSAAGGVISTGPMYVWYPMLEEMRSKGVSESNIAVFLYARALKPALLPVMVFYFGAGFTIVFSLLILTFSFVQGWIVSLFGGVKDAKA